MSSTRIDQDDATPFLRISGLSILTVLLGALAVRADDSAAATETEDTEPHTVEKTLIKPLINGQSLTSDEWVFVSKQKDSKMADTWTVMAGDDDPVLICRGAPYGYLRTRQEFTDFEMELEWKFPADENGNSGILLHTAEEDRVWPKAIQVQLHQPVAGSIFPSGDAKTDNEIRDVRDVAKPVNQWNVCRISSRGGTISVEMNGRKVGEVTGCLPNKGWIALQSEGSEVHFRRIRIRELPPAAVTEPPGSKTGWLVPTRPVRGQRGVRATCRTARETAVRWSVCRGWVTTIATLAKRRTLRFRKTSYVVYRDSLAADAHHSGRGDWLLLDVGRASSAQVACWGDRLRRTDRRRLGI